MDAKAAQLDRDVAQAAATWGRAVRALWRGGAAGLAELQGEEGGPDGALSNPLAPFRRVSSRATYERLVRPEVGLGAELGLLSTVTPAAPDPHAVALARWVQYLTLERVLFSDRVRIAEAWHAPTASVEPSGGGRPGPAEGALRASATGRESARDALLGLLGASRQEVRRAYAEQLVDAAGPIVEAARIEADRRQEATRLLGVEPDATPLELPCDPPVAALEVAARLLEQTAPLLEPSRRWDEALGRAVARDATEGWPARPNARWVEVLFREGGLAEGLVLDLGQLPRALGASSFARALGRFGAALSDACMPRTAPFALTRSPFDVRRARRAALFAALPADPVFCVKHLGLGRARARDQARVVARALLLTLRLDAAQLRLTQGHRVGLPGNPLLMGRREGGEHFEEETRRALGIPLPAELVGVVPALDAGVSVHLLGALLAACDRYALVQRFDEDWFRNPRAVEAIREDDGVFRATPGLLGTAMLPTAVTGAELDEGFERLMADLSDLG
ncbi:hypothetical protein [Chondromyces crocatus]|uniref:Uncharacterized protein n=1 Tax=Chondromyces crocatus TaxID=52 RepID=A0A0K1ETP2_CHOCO|nr:hypothetical protein [Chondromyces crocatus]AKT44226.1 uncharacterized protein CMC5_084660 [Chondromyces crocatus]